MNTKTKTSDKIESCHDKDIENTAKKPPTERPRVRLHAPRRLSSAEALRELTSEKKFLPACESSSACSRTPWTS